MLVEEVAAGVELLRKLLTFCDHMLAHFSQLSELQPEDLPHLGYSTLDDYKRLYAIRIECTRALLQVGLAHSAIRMAFPPS